MHKWQAKQKTCLVSLKSGFITNNLPRKELQKAVAKLPLVRADQKHLPALGRTFPGRCQPTTTWSWSKHTTAGVIPAPQTHTQRINPSLTTGASNLRRLFHCSGPAQTLPKCWGFTPQISCYVKLDPDKWGMHHARGKEGRHTTVFSSSTFQVH